jgi:hypothetical protein
MSSDIVYVCDSTSLIDLFQHFPVEFKRLRRKASDGIIKIPEGVFRELRRKTDKLRHYIEQWEQKYQFAVRLKSDPRFLPELARIEQTYGEKVSVGGKDYPGFWKSPGGRNAADGQVVTIGKVRGYVVVSDDKAVRFACLQENVQCIGWTEFARRFSKGELEGQTRLDL